ncbi:30S ribosomal protein S17 [Candidatus Woesearchaeota archaeon]|nr:30S ribosomal protein S17 [Candidatus Woesearchaeota archaeon]
MEKTKTGESGKEPGIGMGIPFPKAACNDINCPFHGTLKVRGKTFAGSIVSAKMRKTAGFALERREFIRKYQRYEKRLTSIKVHNPDCISAKEGDKAVIMECRPLSKTKKFVIVRKY